MDFLDKKWIKRKGVAEKFLSGSIEECQKAPEGGTDFEWEHPWKEIIRRHPTQVYRHRFHRMLVRQYFFYCPKQLKSSSDLVTLVKADWDGAVEGKSVRQQWDQVDLSDNVSVTECPAGEAYETLVQYVEGKKV